MACQQYITFSVCLLILNLLISCKSVQPEVSGIDTKLSTSTISETDSLVWPESFALGRMATTEEISRWDIDVSPDGKGLPAGSGNVQSGRILYAVKCASCHGRTGVEGPYNRLVTAKGDTTSKEKTIGNYWPYATTVFDYIRRTMPFSAPGSLTDEEVYSLTAFLLYANGIIDSTTVLNAETLPKVSMPAQQLFVPDDRQGGTEIR
jgi:S-disulfanyl-L-cysteine oxidoreductase SoxD